MIFVSSENSTVEWLSAERLAELRDTWPAEKAIGLQLANDADPTDLSADLDRVSAIALEFPKFTDGRAYTQARTLRKRLGFRGEIRATGEVLVDMLPLLERTGFDAAELRADQDPEAARRALGRFGEGHYQGDARESRPRFARTRSPA